MVSSSRSAELLNTSNSHNWSFTCKPGTPTVQLVGQMRPVDQMSTSLQAPLIVSMHPAPAASNNCVSHFLIVKMTMGVKVEALTHAVYKS